MTLINNKFWDKLQDIYGDDYRNECPKDTGYTYGQLWRFASGQVPPPLLLTKYIDMRLREKRDLQKIKNALELTKSDAEKDGFSYGSQSECAKALKLLTRMIAN